MVIGTLVFLLIIGSVSTQPAFDTNVIDAVADAPTPPPVDVPGTGFVDKETLYALLEIIEKDGFVNITTVPVRGGKHEDSVERKKRSTGHFGGGGCGSYPGVGVRFSTCFNPGRVVYQNNHIVHNYYRTGGYGNCLNYFNALPLASVHPVSSGYSGQLFGGYGRTYTVSACRSCYGGNSGIGIRCNNAPYNYLSRQFVFTPSVKNINVNVGGYGGGYRVGYSGSYRGGYGGGYGGVVAAAPVAVAAAPVAVATAPIAVGVGGGCYGGSCRGYSGGCQGSHC